jgi:hypothetical protein
MKTLEIILSIIASVALTVASIMYTNEHIHVMCLFGKCAAVVN